MLTQLRPEDVYLSWHVTAPCLTTVLCCRNRLHLNNRSTYTSRKTNDLKQWLWDCCSCAPWEHWSPEKSTQTLPQGRAGTRQLSVLRKLAVTNIVSAPTLLKFGRSHWGRNLGWRCSRIGCWGWCLGLSGKGQQGSGENYVVGNLMICTAHQILFRWSNKE